MDRGKEFTCYFKVEADLKVLVYFSDAYSSWCIGSNENANALSSSRVFLNKTDLARVSEEEIHEAKYLMNHRPRQCQQLQDFSSSITMNLSLKI